MKRKPDCARCIFARPGVMAETWHIDLYCLRARRFIKRPYTRHEDGMITWPWTCPPWCPGFIRRLFILSKGSDSWPEPMYVSENR